MLPISRKRKSESDTVVGNDVKIGTNLFVR